MHCQKSGLDIGTSAAARSQLWFGAVLLEKQNNGTKQGEPLTAGLTLAGRNIVIFDCSRLSALVSAER